MDGLTRRFRHEAGRWTTSRARRDLTQMFWPIAVAAALLLAVTALALLTGCSLSSETSTLPGIGERASNDALSVTVHAIKFYDEVTSESGVVIKPDSRKDVFIVADLTIRNDQDTITRVDPQSVRLVREGGDYQIAAPTSSTRSLPRDFTALRARPLGVGKQVRGMVVFVMARGTVLEKMVYVTDPEIGISLAEMTVRAPEREKPPRIGQTAEAGGLALKVRSVTYPTKLTHGWWTTTAKKGSKMVVVDLTLKNLDRTPAYKIDPYDVVVIDSRGRYHVASFSIMGMASSAMLHAKRLKPGMSVGGKIVTSIGKRTKVKTIRYEVGVMGPPLEVSATH